jgi:hypothetical protein
VTSGIPQTQPEQLPAFDVLWSPVQQQQVYVATSKNKQLHSLYKQHRLRSSSFHGVMDRRKLTGFTMTDPLVVKLRTLQSWPTSQFDTICDFVEKKALSSLVQFGQNHKLTLIPGGLFVHQQGFVRPLS